MWEKIKQFFIKICPSKRKIIQLYAALLHNAYMMGFISGEIFKGDSKIVCAPGLNCYSCPGAVGACPLGTIQNALYESKTKTPTYVIGIILLYCIIFGRTICGWLCPIGLLQELLYKIKTPKLKKSRVTRALSYFKYILLGVLVIAIPLIFSGKNVAVPGFCKYICPAGTLGGAISLLINPNNKNLFAFLGPIFTWKFLVLIIFVVCSIFIFRFFCRFLCPLGAIYGIFNKLSILGVKVDKSKCDNCGACVAHCKMDVKEVGDHECIMCGECKDVCHVNAIHWKTIGKLVEKDLADAGFVAATDLGDVRLNNNDVKQMEMEASLNSDESYNEEKPELLNPTPADPVIDEIINPKKKFKITLMHQRIFKITSYILMAALLIFTFVYSNFMIRSVLEVNDAAKDVIVTLYDGEQYFSRRDDASTILYFYDEVNEKTKKDLATLSGFTTDELLVNKEAVGKLNVIAISKYSNKDSNYEAIKDLELTEYVKFGYDDEKSSVLKSFVFEEDIKYPYFVSLDISDKVTIKTDKIFTNHDFVGTIYPGVVGFVIGNQVGNVCVNMPIGIVDKPNETFEVNLNRGKVTVINFWYTTCTPCVLELPDFNEVKKLYGDKIEVIAIHNGKLHNFNPAETSSYISKKFADFEIKFGYDTKTNDYYNALGGTGYYPMTIIVDKDGIISFTGSQSMHKADLIREIDKIL